MLALELAFQRPPPHLYRVAPVHPGLDVHRWEEVLGLPAHLQPFGMGVDLLQGSVVPFAHAEPKRAKPMGTRDSSSRS